MKPGHLIAGTIILLLASIMSVYYMLRGTDTWGWLSVAVGISAGMSLLIGADD